MPQQEKTDAPAANHTYPWWLLFTFDNPLRKLFHNPVKLLAPYVKAGDTNLDVGCGMGASSLGLAQLVGEDGQVICADCQDQMLAGLQQHAVRVGLSDRIRLWQSAPDHHFTRKVEPPKLLLLML